MNRGFSLIEVLTSLILLSVLSTSLLFYLDGYKELRLMEKRRLEAFREASALMEVEIDNPPFCVEETQQIAFDSWGEIHLSRARINENGSLVLTRIQVFSKKIKRLFSQLERIIECRKKTALL